VHAVGSDDITEPHVPITCHYPLRGLDHRDDDQHGAQDPGHLDHGSVTS
jgi:hypothetical protein